MDDLQAAVVAVAQLVPVDRAGEWFGVVCGAFDDSGGDLGVFREAVVTGAAAESFPNEVAETFLQVLENEIPEPTMVLSELAARRDDLPALYGQWVAVADDGGPSPAELGYDESTGLFYDEAGNRYLRDSSGENHALQWTEYGLWWVSTDGEDHWFQADFTPQLGADAGAEPESAEAEAVEDEGAEDDLEIDLSDDDAEIAEALVEEVATAVSESIDASLEELAAEFGLPVEDVRRLYEEAIEPDAIEQAVQAGVQAGA
jgi:hypothetical protein